MLNIELNNTKNLLRVLGTVENILKLNKSENDLKYVKFEKLNNELYLIAINPFMKFCYKINDVVSAEGDCALYDNKTLMSLFSVIEDKVIIGDGIIKSEKCKYNIPNITIENYPEFIKPENTNKIEVDSLNFVDAIQNVISAVDKNEGVLSGIYLNNEKLAGCDQKRVFINDIDIKDINDVILSKDFVNEVIKLPFEEKMYLSLLNNNIIAEDSNIYLSCNLLAGKYPKYEAILPKDIKNEVNIDKEKLEKALTLVAPIIDDNTWACNLEFKNDSLLVYTKDGKRKAETSFEIQMLKPLADSIKVKFNIQILLDMLKANSKIVNIKIYNDNIGLMFSSGKAKQYIMPLVD